MTLYHEPVFLIFLYPILSLVNNALYESHWWNVTKPPKSTFPGDYIVWIIITLVEKLTNLGIIDVASPTYASISAEITMSEDWKSAHILSADIKLNCFHLCAVSSNVCSWTNTTTASKTAQIGIRLLGFLKTQIDLICHTTIKDSDKWTSRLSDDSSWVSTSIDSY